MTPYETIFNSFLKRIEDKMLKDEIYTQFTSKQFAKILED